MADELKRLIIRRGLLKGTLTRIKHFIDNPDNLILSLESLKARKEKLLLTMTQYEEVQLEILALDPNDKEEMDVVEEKYFIILSKLNERIKTLTETDVSRNPSISSAKLPNIDIPIFTGKDFTKYSPFIDLFNAVIDKNNSLSDVQKLFYLRKYVSDDALAIIVNLPLVNESYKQALELLRKRFDNKARLIGNHINVILELPNIQKGTAASIRRFVSDVQQQLHALANLKQPVDQWDMLLISILSKKLDIYTNRAFQLERNIEVLPTVAEFIAFLEKRATALEDSGERSPHESTSKAIYKVSNVATNSNSFKRSCNFCNGAGHLLYGCPSFKLAPTSDRLKFVQDNNLCKNCLNDHKGCCRLYIKCKNCKKATHNTLLHEDFKVNLQENVTLHANSSCSQVLLPTIKVKVFDVKGHQLFVRALLDTGSQASFITKTLMTKLSLKPISRAINIIGIGTQYNNFNAFVNLDIHSPVQGVQLKIKCNVVNSITTQLPQQHLNLRKYKLPDNVILSDDNFNVPGEISLLLGADIYFSILLDGHIRLQDGPVLQNTLFGYVVGGVVSCNSSSSKNEVLVSNLAICNTEKLENIMQQFWLSEKLPEISCIKATDAHKAEQIFLSSVVLKDNKFYVDLPLVTALDQLSLGDSFSVALQRFLALEKRFKMSPTYLHLYKKFIDEYIALGHAKVVDVGSYDILNGPVYFLAHHAVFNENSKTTKLRVVFNGSGKTKNKISLNDVMLNGPTVQSELFDILIRFRTYIYTLICDMTKMFRTVYINKHHRSLQNILWRDDPLKPILCLQLQTVTYGLKSSNYLATRCLIKLAEDYKDIYPLASQAMHCNTYVDDILSGANSLEQLIKLKNELVELLSKGGFTLHKWCSNVPDILNDIPAEQKYFEKLEMDKSNVLKTLGLRYDVLPDQFTFSIPVINSEKLQTKRSVLSFIGKMFDPLGLIGPIIVIAKIFMQELWSIKMDWDTTLPQVQLDSWNRFLTNLAMMDPCTVPRGIISKDSKIVELIGFSDASIKAFGCCLYLRVFDQHGNVQTNLLCSKSRVAPLNKSLTIPKLELNSALLLSQLVQRVEEKLKAQLFSFKVYLYSDSQIVLVWLQSHKTIKDPYVSRRINQIKILTKTSLWSHVRSENNPADLLSRGTDPQKLKLNKLWWHGPAFLGNIEFVHTPITEILAPPFITHEVVTANVCNSGAQGLDLFQKYSNLSKLQRIVAYLKRFVYNCRNKNNKSICHLSPNELNDSLMNVISVTQHHYFYSEILALVQGKPIKSSIANLHPFLDSNNVLRVGGRLQNAVNLPYEKIHPAIIPKSTHLTRLIIEREHLRLLHAGAKLVLSSLSQTLYLVSGISEVKKVVHKCIRCFRLKAVVAKQLMGSLPTNRVTPQRPFQTVGVDFCGPFKVKVARIRKPLQSKAYIALFVCFVTKAIHAELVTDLTTDAFLACLRRFIARRGLPTLIYCDNAKTFKGASNNLKELYDLFNSKSHKDEVISFSNEKMINFKFIPAYSPEFGGLWEAGVKSLKYHLKRVVGDLSLTFEGLYTVVTEIEAILNSRPLLPMSSEISDTNYLTPGHFLIGTTLTSYPERNLSDTKIERLKFWNILTKLKQDFWISWSRDYLTQLQNRPKWNNEYPNLMVGDLVIVRSDNSCPFQWPMARIVKTIDGPDGRVRVAEIKVGNKISTRSYRKLCPLPIK